MLECVKITVKIHIRFSEKSPIWPLLWWPVLTEFMTTVKMSLYMFAVFPADMPLIWLSAQPNAANLSCAVQTEPITYCHGHWSKACTWERGNIYLSFSFLNQKYFLITAALAVTFLLYSFRTESEGIFFNRLYISKGVSNKGQRRLCFWFIPVWLFGMSRARPDLST